MDSSTTADYQFMMSDPTSKKSPPGPPSTGNSTSKYVIIGVTLAAILVSAVVIGIIVAIVVSTTETSTPATQQGLVNTYVTNDNFSSEYYGSDGTGIHITGTMQDDMFILNITTTTSNGADYSIMFIMHSMAMNMTVVGVEDTNFMVMENRPGRPRYDDYIVPMSAMNETMSIMRGEEMMSDDMFEKYDNTTVKQILHGTLYNLATSDEAVLIIEAALALGEMGIQGSDYNIVMRFYALALRLQAIRGTVINDIEQPTLDVSPASERNHRKKRASQCGNSPCSYINIGCPTGSECIGLCGPHGCLCWRFVCGDCCAHTYCKSHDECCTKYGRASWQCLSITYKVDRRSCPYTYVCDDPLTR